MKEIDFTSCTRVLNKAYNGANGNKIAVLYDNTQYMLKFPPSARNKPTELSYTNSCYSEHLASSIFNMLGVKAQETMLGSYTVNNKEKIVCACKDFTVDGKQLYDFCSIKNTVIDSEHGGTGTEILDILDTIQKQQFVNPLELVTHFWDVFVIDALLGNFDRHNGNWGFLYDSKTDTTEIAPVYDCGSCLLPQADEKTMITILNDERELESRIYRFPTSAIKSNGIKINYYEFLTDTPFSLCKEALCRITPRIDIQMIKEFIENTPYLTMLQKDFYCTYVEGRYEKIIMEAYKINKLG